MSDRLGRKPLMVAGTVTSVLASAVLTAGQAGQVPIYLGRLLTGVAVGIAMSVGTTWVRRCRPTRTPRCAAPRSPSPPGSASAPGSPGAGPVGPWPMVTRTSCT
ncbi:MFS transporter [Streptomyces sp. M19]